MKNLKLFVAGALVSLIGGLSVSAATLDELVEGGKLELVNGIYKLKGDTATVTADIELASGTAILDLNGKTLTNEGTKNSAIWVKAGANLTIKDSVGNGKITYSGSSEPESVGSTYAPIINNAGTLTLESGLIEVNKGTSNENGTGILNTSNLTVNGGTIKTTVVGSWGITNEGTADIKGGEFVQGQDFSIIVNAKTLNIKGGTFKNDGSVTHNSLLTNKDDVEEAKIVIEDGTFDDSIVKLFHNKDDRTSGINIVKGNFPLKFKTEVTKYLDEGSLIDDEGNVVVDVADYTDLDAKIEEVEELLKEEGIKDKYTEESIKALEEALEAAKELSRTLKLEEQDDVDAMLVKLNDAVEALKEVEKDYVKEFKELLNKAKAVDTTKYTEESVEALTKALEEAKAIESTIDTALEAKVKEVNALLKAALDGLKQKPQEIPNTLDFSNNTTLLFLGSIGVIGGALVLKRKLRLANR